MASNSVSVTEIRAILAGTGMEPISEAAVSQFVSQGMPKTGKGLYDRDVCVGWYLARLRNLVRAKQAESMDDDGQPMEQVEKRAKLAKAQLDELTLAERRGEMIPLHVFVSEMTQLVQVTKQRMLNLPARLAPKLHDCSSIEIKALLSASIRDALSELARKGVALAERMQPGTDGEADTGDDEHMANV